MRSVHVRETGPRGKARRRGCGPQPGQSVLRLQRRRERAKTSAGVALAEESDPRIRLAVALERHNPGKSSRCYLATEMNLHSIEAGKRDLELRAMHEHARNAEPECAVETIAGAAGEDDCSCLEGSRGAGGAAP